MLSLPQTSEIRKCDVKWTVKSQQGLYLKQQGNLVVFIEEGSIRGSDLSARRDESEATIVKIEGPQLSYRLVGNLTQQVWDEEDLYAMHCSVYAKQYILVRHASDTPSNMGKERSNLQLQLQL